MNWICTLIKLSSKISQLFCAFLLSGTVSPMILPNRLLKGLQASLLMSKFVILLFCLTYSSQEPKFHSLMVDTAKVTLLSLSLESSFPCLWLSGPAKKSPPFASLVSCITNLSYIHSKIFLDCFHPVILSF